MTPAARIAAAAGVLDRVLAGEAAEAALTRWARASRYAGSGDRAAVRDHVYEALRRMRSLAARLRGPQDGQGGTADGTTSGLVSGRALMIGLAAEAGQDLDALFSGEGHAPAPLTRAERAALARGADNSAECAVRLDVADWQLPLFRQTLGDRTGAVLDRMRHRAPAFVRVNVAICDRDTAIRCLAKDGIAAESHPLAETALLLRDGSSRLRLSRTYLDGLVELQDASGQAACTLLPLRDGARVLDFCAGGGGKTLAIAALAARDRRALTVIAHDSDPGRMADLPLRARRARLADCSPSVNIRFLDLPAIRRLEPFDIVLVDAPCTGSGTWARTPDAKWRMTANDLADHITRQAGILDVAQSFVDRDGGVLAYMTCSMFPGENSAQIAGFTARSPDWRVTLERQFDPTEGGDGFYVAILTRSAA